MSASGRSGFAGVNVDIAVQTVRNKMLMVSASSTAAKLG
jgi:hypothetical protein